MDKPIPALYCCYLLRSTVSHRSLYIGSTPNPPRRLKQHNGGTNKGGANKTDNDKLKPWDMVCLVTGFPSKIAALQFEWAWQRPDVTRHIHPSERITHPRVTARWSNKRQKHVKKASCPPMALSSRLSNLHLLLRSPSFRHWPLFVRFYAGDVHNAWVKMTKNTLGHLQPGMLVTLEKSTPPLGATVGGAATIDPTYRIMKPQLERTNSLLTHTSTHACSICAKSMSTSSDLMLVCPTESCNATSHLDCLSNDFLNQREINSGHRIVPTTGSCRKCGTTLHWDGLVRDLSLRLRGQSVLQALFKPPRSRKAALNAKAAQELEEEEERRLSGLVGDDAEESHNEDDDTVDVDVDLVDEDDAEITDDPAKIRRISAEATTAFAEASKASNLEETSCEVITISDSDSESNSHGINDGWSDAESIR